MWVCTLYTLNSLLKAFQIQYSSICLGFVYARAFLPFCSLKLAIHRYIFSCSIAVSPLHTFHFAKQETSIDRNAFHMNATFFHARCMCIEYHSYFSLFWLAFSTFCGLLFLLVLVLLFKAQFSWIFCCTIDAADSIEVRIRAVFILVRVTPGHPQVGIEGSVSNLMTFF